MKYKWDRRYLHIGVTAFAVIVSSIAVFMALYNFKIVSANLGGIIKIANPILIGLVLAYILNPILNFFENRCFLPIFRGKVKKPESLSRGLGVLSTFIVFALAVYLLVLLIVPQIISSIVGIFDNFDAYYKNFSSWITNTLDNNPDIAQFLSVQIGEIGDIAQSYFNDKIIPEINKYINQLTSGVIGVFNVLKNLLIGVIISLYVMAYKHSLIAQCKKLLYAFTPVKFGNLIVRNTKMAHKIFGGFINGKLLDSIIIGILCFILMMIFKMPYAVLISVIIGVTNIIPFFGPFFGAIPSILLLLLVDPMMALYFGILVLALQQFDGNILGPKILGDSTGLSSFWVMFTIILSGGLFGFSGMVLGVPVFALIYQIVKELAQNKLEKKNLKLETVDYDNLNYILDGEIDGVDRYSYDVNTKVKPLFNISKIKKWKIKKK